MRKIAEVMGYVGTIVGNASVVILCISIVLSIAVYASRHMTCVNIFDKVCFVY